MRIATTPTTTRATSVAPAVIGFWYCSMRVHTVGVSSTAAPAIPEPSKATFTTASWSPRALSMPTAARTSVSMRASSAGVRGAVVGVGPPEARSLTSTAR
jgi:hypothetical protein